MFDVAEVRWPPARNLLGLAAAAVVALQPGCDVSARHRAMPASRAVAAHDGVAVTASGPSGVPTRAAVDFKTFALNALLVPLLDDAEPPRWVEPSLAFDCGERVTVGVDGRRLSPGGAVPELPFTLAWKLDDCSPLGSTMALRGEVDVVVLRQDGTDYVGEVRPRRLRVTSPEGNSVLDTAFIARTPHGKPAAATDAHSAARRPRTQG